MHARSMQALQCARQGSSCSKHGKVWWWQQGGLTPAAFVHQRRMHYPPTRPPTHHAPPRPRPGAQVASPCRRAHCSASAWQCTCCSLPLPCAPCWWRRVTATITAKTTSPPQVRGVGGWLMGGWVRVCAGAGSWVAVVMCRQCQPYRLLGGITGAPVMQQWLSPPVCELSGLGSSMMPTQHLTGRPAHLSTCAAGSCMMRLNMVRMALPIVPMAFHLFPKWHVSLWVMSVVQARCIGALRTYLVTIAAGAPP